MRKYISKQHIFPEVITTRACSSFNLKLSILTNLTILIQLI